MTQEKIISILGAGESGVGAALLAKAKGYTAYVSDSGTIAEKYKQELRQNEIPYEENDHTLIKLCTPEVIKSPGIPNEAKIVQQLKQVGSQMISEIEWGGRFTLGTKIAVTGTNGKTTTTKLVHHLLATAGKDAALAGNIGTSFARLSASEKHDFWALEVSSFQLEGLRKFKCGVGVLLNITPDHLDRYNNDFEAYAAAKLNLVRHVDPNGALVAHLDDPTISAALSADQPRCRVLGFGHGERPELAAYRTDAELVFREPSELRVPLEALPIKGEHNQLNALAAILAVLQAGVDPEAITEGLLTFQGEPHRLEEVAKKDGITYVNDSKATNVEAVKYALGAFREPIVWIAGGVDKGNDYGQLMEASVLVKGMVALGTDNQKLKDNFGDLIPDFKEAGSMLEAVKAAQAMASEGDVVLLSPACASFDLFKNYEDRGNQFKKAIAEL